MLETVTMDVQPITIENEFDISYITDADDLPVEDGIPMETPRHREAMNHLIEATQYHWRNRPDDYYVGGNMFVYYSRQQVRNRDYRGPDFFIVDDVDGSIERQSWVVWEENGRYPDLIVELLSPSTTETDKTTKKRLYERTFRTHEYFCYDPFSGEFIGWRLVNNQYDRIQPNQQDRLWSEVLQAYLGYWEGIYQNRDGIWLRIFDSQGELIPTQVEAAIDARQVAEEKANHEAQARQVAEEKANHEAQARQVAEEKANHEAQARQVAEEKANHEAQRANEMEQQLRQLQAELAQLRK